MPTLRELLLHNFNISVEVSDDNHSTARNPGAADNYRVINPVQNHISVFNSNNPDYAFGPRSDFTQRIFERNGDDHLNGYRRFQMVIHNEGEVSFLLWAAMLPLQARFRNALCTRFEVAPRRETSSFAGTVDCRVDFAPLDEGVITGTGTIGTATIIELKKPGTLAYANFRNHTAVPTRTKERLGQKWRWYCRNYRVSQFVALDGEVAMGIMFFATENETHQFKTCATRLIHATGSEVAYLIFRILEQGIARLFGEAYGQRDLKLDGWERKHRYFDGMPYWRKAGEEPRKDHPEGWVRRYSNENGVHVWEKAGRNSVSEYLVPHARTVLRELF